MCVVCVYVCVYECVCECMRAHQQQVSTTFLTGGGDSQFFLVLFYRWMDLYLKGGVGVGGGANRSSIHRPCQEPGMNVIWIFFFFWRRRRTLIFNFSCQCQETDRGSCVCCGNFQNSLRTWQQRARSLRKSRWSCGTPWLPERRWSGAPRPSSMKAGNNQAVSSSIIFAMLSLVVLVSVKKKCHC